MSAVEFVSTIAPEHHRRHRSPLAALLDGIEASLTDHHTDAERARAVADVLAPALGDPRLLSLEHRRASPDRYRTNIVHVAADGSFSVVALVWLPGQRTPVHSHRSWCVVGVHQGDEREVGYEVDHGAGGSMMRPTSSHLYRTGAVTWLPAGDDGTHHVENAGTQIAISIHVYALDYRLFGSSILKTFPTADSSQAGPRPAAPTNPLARVAPEEGVPS
jgi:predicted metal-dependent enzyme (double-stranded beta helix superfamily)